MVERADTLALYNAYGIGRGTVEAFTVASPAVASSAIRTTGQGYFERIVTLTFLFTADANAANRGVTVSIQDADQNQLAQATAGAVVTANQAMGFGAGIAQTTTTASAGLRLSIALPSVFIQPGWRLVIAASSIQAGDQFSAIRGVVERFGIGPDGTPIGETELPYTERGRGYARALESE